MERYQGKIKKEVLKMNKNLDNELNRSSNCSPLSSMYCNLKLRITGDLKGRDLENLYNCNLCNQCHLAGVNLSAREIGVKKGIIARHVAGIRENISEYGNSYGIQPENANNVLANNKSSNAETILFKGCTPSYKTREILKAADNLLKAEKIEYITLDNETCCGNILFNLGEVSAGEEAVRRNMDKFQQRGVKRIITLCPGCYNAFNKYYQSYDGFNPEIILLVDLISEITIESAEFTIQDPCHAREKGSVVRNFLPNSSNKTNSPCCGAGAGVMAHNPEIATSKAFKALEDNEITVTYCPFCYLNLSGVKPEKVKDFYMLINENRTSNPEITLY